MNAILHEAKVAAKTPSNTGIWGVFIGRTVASLIGTEGLSEDDPIIHLENVKQAVTKYIINNICLNDIVVNWKKLWKKQRRFQARQQQC